MKAATKKPRAKMVDELMSEAEARALGVDMKTPLKTKAPSTALIDALTLELEKADSLTVHLEDRLEALAGENRELYALSVVAGTICDLHEVILKNAHRLFEAYNQGRAK
jgi:hypothetical protein